MVNFNTFIIQKPHHLNKTYNTIGFNMTVANQLHFSTSLS